MVASGQLDASVVAWGSRQADVSGTKNITFSDAALEVMHSQFLHTLLVTSKSHTSASSRGGVLDSTSWWEWHPTPVLLPGKSHGWRSLVGCSPWGRKESDMTERLHFHFSLSCIGEGNGNLLQCSCLENPRDGEAWWAAIYGVAQSRTRLKRLSSSSRAWWEMAEFLSRVGKLWPLDEIRLPLQGSRVWAFTSCLWLCHSVEAECLGQILCGLQSQKYLLYNCL